MQSPATLQFIVNDLNTLQGFAGGGGGGTGKVIYSQEGKWPWSCWRVWTCEGVEQVISQKEERTKYGRGHRRVLKWKRKKLSGAFELFHTSENQFLCSSVELVRTKHKCSQVAPLLISCSTSQFTPGKISSPYLDYRELCDLAQGSLWPITCSSSPYSAGATLAPLLFFFLTYHACSSLGIFSTAWNTLPLDTPWLNPHLMRYPIKKVFPYYIF